MLCKGFELGYCTTNGRAYNSPARYPVHHSVFLYRPNNVGLCEAFLLYPRYHIEMSNNAKVLETHPTSLGLEYDPILFIL